jgi:hypothetical protein
MINSRYILYRIKYPYCESPNRSLHNNLDNNTSNSYCDCSGCSDFIGIIHKELWLWVYIVCFYLLFLPIIFFIPIILFLFILYIVTTLFIIVNRRPKFDYIIGA